MTSDQPGTKAPKITSIRYSITPYRAKPKAGDVRETKAHGKQVRVMKKAYGPRGEYLGYDCTGGKQRYEWIGVDEAVEKGYGYLLKNII